MDEPVKDELYERCKSEVARKYGLGKTLVIGHLPKYYEEVAKLYHSRLESDAGKNLLKILFLDFDGVVNHELFFRDRHEGRNDAMKLEHPLSEIDPISVGFVSQIVEQTGAKVVVSSSWRLGRTVKELQDMLEQCGFTGEVIGTTPVLDMHHDALVRGNEILKWMIDNKNLVGSHFYYRNYCILDDDQDFLLYHKDNFIQIDSYCGVTPKDAQRAIKILNMGNGITVL